MVRFSLQQPGGVLRLNLLLVLVLLVPAAAGVFAPLEAALREVMLRRPLPPFWFPLFIGVGALLPLLLRLLGRHQPAVRRVLNPYLLLLAGQIVAEVVVVLVGGKGLGVLVGWLFTLVRLAQLGRLWPHAAAPAWLRLLLLLELGLWGLNAAQMLANRWLPLLA